MSTSQKSVPRYLRGYADLWETDPKAANLAWWKEAKFGLFIHYGLYSQLGAGEWAQLRQRIPVAEYKKLRNSFSPTNFDADHVTDLALEAEMRYVNIVSCHHDSFVLWDSKIEAFNSMNSPARRDLVGELAEQCNKKGLGLFTYYTYALNWRHPYFLSREYFEHARPAYETAQPEYKFKRIEDFQRYRDYVHAMLRELLTSYTPLAGIWLDLIMMYYAQPDLIPVEETYALIRELQPHALISFKQGATGDEDFATPEQHFHSLADQARQSLGEKAAQIAERAWNLNQHKHNEVNATMQSRMWGYAEHETHKSADDVYRLLAHAHSHNCNLLLNVGPLPDGAIHPEDLAALRAVGERIRRDGWPETSQPSMPAPPIDDPDNAGAAAT